MEWLSQSLQPYKGFVGQVASYLTILQFFSGAFICREIQKKGSCKDISSVPFVGGVMIGLAFLKYGMMLKDEAMLTVNVFAIVLNVIYCIFYYIYATDKWNEFLKPLSVNIAIVAVLWGYCEWEDPELIEFRYGFIVTILMLLLLGNPLIGLKGMIEKKDASQIPFVLTLMGTLVTFSWLLYAIILMNNFMLVQNVIGFILCGVQLALIFIYPGQGKPPPINKKKKN
ncbi:MtN3 slv domain containing protein [Asbolus verrucosus]|uniref:Sugar transporter SWEET n=1 Tax=Asbolus verrucosus TaxID=1661398 RepID=A0A482W7K8_ASBVE|nr:MtN3 slv domain containing protein [Asbolus verrucosus]